MGLRFPALGVDTIIDSKQITDFGTVTLRGDLRSYAWDGGSDLSGGADASATAGFFLDSSAGAGQFKSLFAEGIIVASAGSDIDWSYISNVSITNADIVSLSFDKITAASNGASLVIGASGSVSSANYSAGTTGFQILGTGAAEFNNVTVRGTVEASAGSFSGTLTLGGVINFTSGGIIRTASSGRRVELIATTTGVTTLDYYNAGGAVFGRLYSDSSMGNALSLSALGSLTLRGDTTIQLIAGGGSNITVLDNNQLLLGTNGSAATPASAFASDPDTGTYRVGANVWGVSTGGTISLQVGSAVTIAIPSTTGSGTALMVTTPDGNGNYTILRSTSSRKYKSRITYNVEDRLADLELAPAKFYRKDDKAWSYGFIAEDLAAADPLLGVAYDGEVENYDQRAVLAVLAAKVNRLETELARLKEAA